MGCELRAGPRQAWAGLKKGAGLVGLPAPVGGDLKCRGRLTWGLTSGVRRSTWVKWAEPRAKGRSNAAYEPETWTQFGLEALHDRGVA